MLLETVAALKRGYKLIAHQGGTWCFAPETKVITARGLVAISDIVKGDIVKTFNEKSGQIEWKKVRDKFNFKNQKKTVKIRLKSGISVTCTEDHEFYHNGKWVPIIDILKSKQ